MFCAGADLGGDQPAFARDHSIRVPDTRDGYVNRFCSILTASHPARRNDTESQSESHQEHTTD
jgi:hypothetical protein